MFKTSTLTEWNKSKSKPTQVRFADLFFKQAFDFVRVSNSADIQFTLYAYYSR